MAFEVLSLYIDRSIISENELKDLLRNAYEPFEKEEVIPIHKLSSRKETYIMELFYGPTISFKDVGMAFLVNIVNFFLHRKNEYLNLIVATTGDTGPAAAYFSAGKSNLDTWVLYPTGLITEEQKRQMTTLPQANIHPVGVSNCPDGGDNLDEVIAKLYADRNFKETFNLSSVNSINWGRIMMQTVHYFYGYFQVVNNIGEKVNMSVPSGGFGNLCAGALAREMGLPIKYFVSANNENACLHRIFSDGIFSKEDIFQTSSSAIDILFPINFWRFLHLIGIDSKTIKKYLNAFKETQSIKFDDNTYQAIKKGILSYSASDEQTLTMIKDIYESEQYVLDPHAAVSVVASDVLSNELGTEKLMCLATAHPAKFPDVIRRALQTEELPLSAKHHSIESAKTKAEKGYSFDHSNFEVDLRQAMIKNWKLTKKNTL